MPPNAAPLQVAILAAGQGKRMHSDLPKVLHPLAGKALLAHVLDAARALQPARLCVVVGHGGDRVKQELAGEDLAWAHQEQQLGTGHAVMQAVPALAAGGTVLVLYGDVPLIRPSTLRALVDAAGQDRLALLTQDLPDPKGYGRIVRDAQGRVRGIVEEKDATAEQRRITEVNTGIMVIPRPKLEGWLAQLRNANAQGEYYLTDVVAAAVADGTEVVVRNPEAAEECLGVNGKVELAALERRFQLNRAQELLQSGVTLADPARIDIRGTLRCGRDVFIDVNCVFEGEVSLGDGASIGAGCVLKDASVGAGTQVKPYSVIEEASVGADARLGPFARLRPGTRLDDEVHVGNFVEVKATRMGRGSKANHLTYLGDSIIGAACNIGAGTITCNYDGANKHQTVIEDDVHIGSDVQLIAPVTVGKGATVAAGATIMRDVPPGGLTLIVKKQVSKPDWQRPRKKK